MEFILVASAHFLALLSPGPDFFLILQASLRISLPGVISLICGIVTANAIYIGVAVAGVQTFKEMEVLFLVMKYLGGAYLVFLGVMLLKTPRREVAASVSDSDDYTGKLTHQYSIGFLSAILNPKNIIFYLSIFTVMVSRSTPSTLRILYGLWMCGIVFLWDTCIAICIRKFGYARISGNLVFAVEKISGGMLALCGIILPFS